MRTFDIAKHEKELNSWPPEKRLIFVNDLTDTFHEAYSFELIEEWHRLFERHPEREFQLLTKRIGRAMVFYRSRPVPRNVWVGCSIGEKKRLWRLDQLRQMELDKFELEDIRESFLELKKAELKKRRLENEKATKALESSRKEDAESIAKYEPPPMDLIDLMKEEGEKTFDDVVRLVLYRTLMKNASGKTIVGLTRLFVKYNPPKARYTAKDVAEFQQLALRAVKLGKTVREMHDRGDSNWSAYYKQKWQSIWNEMFKLSGIVPKTAQDKSPGTQTKGEESNKAGEQELSSANGPKEQTGRVGA